MSVVGEPNPNRNVAHHAFTQAPVAAVDVDGVGVTSVGTALFGLATILLAALGDQLRSAGNGWWVWVGVAGTGLGLVGLGFCVLRRRRRAAGRWTYN